MDEQQLKNAGVGYEEGLKRFVGRKELYEKYLRQFPADEHFGQLETALTNKDYENAFKCAHALKGITGNLSLNGFYNKLIPLVEDLRIGKTDNADNLFEKLKIEYDEVVAVINS